MLIGAAATAGAAVLQGSSWVSAAPAAAYGGEGRGGGHTTVADTLIVGDPQSERRHRVSAPDSEVVTGLVGQPARRLLSLGEQEIFGGVLAARLAVRPSGPTYVSIKLDGGEFGETELGRLQLFCEGEQVGHYHLGAVDPLDIPGDLPRLVGRFTYHTLPLPLSLTKGRTSVDVEIHSMGRTYQYGQTLEDYYKPLTGPTRAIYRLISHSEPFLDLDDDPQGPAARVSDAPVKPGVGADVISQIEETVDARVGRWITSPYGDPNALLTMAQLHDLEWSRHHDSADLIDGLVAGLDVLTDRVEAGDVDIEADWLGLGRAGRAISLSIDHWRDRLEEVAPGGATRRDRYGAILLTSREHWRRNRRSYTNQSMIVDIGIFGAHLGLAALEHSQAWSTEQANRYLRESIGLEPWRGADLEDGTPSNPYGDRYRVVSPTGLAKELGYVGNYGDEVVGWAHEIHGMTEDPEIREQSVQLMRARAPFRYPLLDVDGYRSFAGENVVGWRDVNYPGKVTYALNATANVNPLMVAEVGDVALAGQVQQMIDDGQAFPALQTLLSNGNSQYTFNLAGVPGQYRALQELAPVGHRLPMTDGEPDFVFADPDAGVIALKDGDTRLYASLYWRARYGVNNFARVHLITPTLERSGTIRSVSTFVDSGDRYVVPDRVNFEFGDGGLQPPGEVPTQAFAGERLPIAATPAEVSINPDDGDENPLFGRADFYEATYGPYVMALNAGDAKTYRVKLPAKGKGKSHYVDVSTGRTVRGSSVAVAPGEAVVLRRR